MEKPETYEERIARQASKELDDSLENLRNAQTQPEFTHLYFHVCGMLAMVKYLSPETYLLVDCLPYRRALLEEWNKWYPRT